MGISDTGFEFDSGRRYLDWNYSSFGLGQPGCSPLARIALEVRGLKVEIVVELRILEN